MTTDLIRKTFPLDLKSVDMDTGEFEGYAACFHNIDAYGDIIAPSCYTDARIKEFLEDGFIGGLNHNWYDPIGRPTSAVADEKGLLIKGTVEATSHGKDVRLQLQKGIVRKLSIGFFIKGRTWLEDSADVEAYWKNVGYKPTEADVANCKYGARLLTDIHTVETSPVVLPANSGASIIDAKSLEKESIPVENLLAKTIALFETLSKDGLSLRSLPENVSPTMVKHLIEVLQGLDSKDTRSEEMELKAQTLKLITLEQMALQKMEMSK